MFRFTTPALAALLLAVALPAAAADAGRSTPLAEGTVDDEASVTLVHTTTPDNYVVCADPHGTGPVTLAYDDNEMDMHPGHCALVEAGRISAHGRVGTHTHVSVHAHPSRSSTGGGSAGGGGEGGGGEGGGGEGGGGEGGGG